MDRTNRTGTTRTRARLLAIAGAVAALTIGIPAGGASAHVAPITADCERGLVISLSQYDPAGVNVLRVWIDGVERSNTTFGAGTTATFSFGDLTVGHTYRVVVDAWDDPDRKVGWSFDTGTRTIPVCATPTTPAPATTSPATTSPATTSPATTSPATSVEPVVSTAPPPTVSVTPSVAPTVVTSVASVVTTVPDVAAAGPTTVATSPGSQVSPATTSPTLPVTGGVPIGPVAALAALLVGVLLALAARRPA